jgi:hypothetical protein
MLPNAFWALFPLNIYQLIVTIGGGGHAYTLPLLERNCDESCPSVKNEMAKSRQFAVPERNGRKSRQIRQRQSGKNCRLRTIELST